MNQRLPALMFPDAWRKPTYRVRERKQAHRRTKKGIVTSEFLDPTVPELRSILAHCGSDWFLSFTTEVL